MAARVMARVLLAVTLLVPVAVTGGALAAQAAPSVGESATRPTVGTRATAEKAPSSRLAESDPALVARTDGARVPVMIKLDYDSVASYQGGVGDLEATSPSATGRPLSGQSSAEREYDSYAAEKEEAAVAELRRRVPEASVGRRFRLVYGGVAAVLPADRIKDVLGIDGVVAVQEDTLLQPLTDSSTEFIGAPTAYNELGGAADAGIGVLYGNLDTGLWPEHPSFADLGNLGAPPARPGGGARPCDFGDNPLTPATDVFACNHKLISGAPFLDTYNAVHGDGTYPDSARDSEGHGTHTASTSAGNVLASAQVFGVERGPINGVAPGAWIAEYKVCGPQGCFSSDSTSAVQAAILDGVDVINFSISGGTSPFTDPVELAFLDAYAAGVFVSASAGNEGPGAATANHLSPWVTSVAASTQRREFRSALSLTAADGATLELSGASITTGIDDPLPVVPSSDPPYSDPLCAHPAPAGLFDGKIVTCVRGGNGRVDKGYNVHQGGAAGMILYNPTLADVETDNHWLPAVHLADGTELVAFLAAHDDVTASFTTGEPADGQGDVMATFSSRGPAGAFVKPDITAPGVQILAGQTPTPDSPLGGPPGELFQAIAGTSMSSPHIAGSAILLAAVHPDWTPGQIRSAMMTTAVTDVVKEDLTTPADPFDMGAGRIDLTHAPYAPLTFDETPERFFALGADPVNAVHLNLPSVDAPVMPGRVTTTRVATNVSGLRQRFTATATSDGGRITVLPRQFALDPNESVTLSITIEATDLPTGGQHFGQVDLASNRGQSLHLPVAFVPGQGQVHLSQTCSPRTIPQRGTSDCVVTAQNDSYGDTTVDLRTTLSSNLRAVGSEGAALTGNRSAELLDVPLAGARPGVPSVVDGASPAGYLPLDGFAGTLHLPIGDEEVVNLDVGGTYTFAGQTFSSLGITSNGYAVAGEGTVEDVAFEPPGVPDPSRPNNVLAPFWTDLDGTNAEGILANVLSDGVDDWLVVEWRENLFGTTSEKVFQLWVGLGDQEDISFAYDPDNLPAAPPAGYALAVGAENVDGSAGQYRTVAPTSDLRITSTDPTPGDSVSYAVTVRGQQSGTGTVTSSMTSDRVPGTTIVRTDLRVLQGPGAGAGAGAGA